MLLQEIIIAYTGELSMSEMVNRKLQYLEESYEVLACLGNRPGQEVFLVRRKMMGKYISKNMSVQNL